MNLTDMYLYINEHEVQKYDGGVLKLYVNNRLIKIISNPTEQDLRMFGYKNLVTAERPEEREGYYIDMYYIDNADYIQQAYRYIEIPPEFEGEVENE